MEPLEISWYGFKSKNSQISTVSCFSGTFFKSTESPTPPATATSQSAPKIPPSVTSCMADTPKSLAAIASGTTEIYFINPWARSTNSRLYRVHSSASRSEAIMDVPSSPTHFVTTISCPGLAPFVKEPHLFYFAHAGHRDDRLIDRRRHFGMTADNLDFQ